MNRGDQLDLRPPRERFLGIARPDLRDEEIDELLDSVRSGWLTAGPKVRRAGHSARLRSIVLNRADGPLWVILDGGTEAGCPCASAAPRKLTQVSGWVPVAKCHNQTHAPQHL